MAVWDPGPRPALKGGGGSTAPPGQSDRHPGWPGSPRPAAGLEAWLGRSAGGLRDAEGVLWGLAGHLVTRPKFSIHTNICISLCLKYFKLPTLRSHISVKLR